MATTDQQYWATLGADEIGKAIKDRITDYYEYMKRRGRLRLWREVHRQYYAGYYSSGMIIETGRSGEKRIINPNGFRAILQRIRAMVSSQRPAFVPRSTNGDYRSYSETIVAKALIDYYLKEQRIEHDEANVLLYALLFGEGWHAIEWDETRGATVATKQVADETGAVKDEPVKEGDISSTTLTPNNVVRDCTRRSMEDMDWVILRRWVNKWTLAGRYPDFSEDIERQQNCVDDYLDTLIDRSAHWDKSLAHNDLIPVFTLYHARTAACPDGLQVTILDDGTALFYGPLPYKRIPVYFVTPEMQVDDVFGYSGPAFDGLTTNRVINMIYSVITTNLNASGGTKILVSQESNINVEKFMADSAFIKYNQAGGKPELMQPPQTPKEFYDALGMLERVMADNAGLNYVTMGDSASTKSLSGAAMALMESLTMRFNGPLQQSFTRYREDYATGIINALQQYATTPRKLQIVGKSKSQYVQEYTGADIKGIDRVQVEIGNPLTQTIAGRTQMAENLIGKGLIKNAQQYVTVVETGNVDTLDEGELNENMLIVDENEAIRRGEVPPVIATDKHTQHVPRHMAVLASTETRKAPEVVKACLDHIQSHIQTAKTLDPDLAAMIGEAPLPSTAAQPVGGPPAPEGAVPPAVAGPEMPKMPVNPSTGQEYTPVPGGQ